MSVASTVDPMRAANRVADRTLFSWRIETLDGSPAMTTCGVPIASDGVFGERSAGDLLIIIAGFRQASHVERARLRYLSSALRRFAMIGGVEAGSWLLARAGLLNGKTATTHWEDLEDFAARFPETDVRADRFVVDPPAFTAGGASPSFDLMLHLIQARWGMPLALSVASVFIYDAAHSGTDAQPLVSTGRLGGHEPRVAAAIDLMTGALDEPLALPVIAKRLSVSTRTLDELFRSALGRSPGRYYRDLRLEAARRMVRDTSLSIGEIGVRTGFSAPSVFSRRFKARFGESPVRYRAHRR